MTLIVYWFNNIFSQEKNTYHCSGIQISVYRIQISLSGMIPSDLLIFLSLIIFQGYGRTLLVKTEESLDKKTKPSFDTKIGYSK